MAKEEALQGRCEWYVRRSVRIPGARIGKPWPASPCLPPLPAMPTYVYEVVKPDGTGGERFELLQSMSEPALEKHPETGAPVRRVITGFAIGGKSTDIGNPKLLSDRNLDRLGFTKYVKSGDGKYEKTVGSGPSQISADE